MEIICIIIIFFFLGLFINNMLPILEGLDCTGGFVYDEDGEVGELGDEDQKTYNENKAKREENLKTESCIRELNNENVALVKSYNDDQLIPFDSSYKKNIVPTSISFKDTQEKFLKSLSALDELVKDDAGNDKKKEEEETECGEIGDPLGASPHEDIGKPIDSKGASCS